MLLKRKLGRTFKFLTVLWTPNISILKQFQEQFLKKKKSNKASDTDIPLHKQFEEKLDTILVGNLFYVNTLNSKSR